MAYHNVLRIPTKHDVKEEDYYSLLEYLHKNGCPFDKVMFFQQSSHAARHTDEAKEKFAVLKKVMEKYRQTLGVKAGLNIICTVGFMSQNVDPRLADYDKRMYSDGSHEEGGLCPSSPMTEEFIHTLYAEAAKAKPDFIYVDDDICGSYCHCPRCLKLYEKQFTGKNLSDGEEMIERRRFVIAEILKKTRKAVDSVNPEIPMGFMVSEFGTLGTDYSEFAQILRNDKEESYCRPGGGNWWEDIDELIIKTHKLGREMAALKGKSSEIHAEIENFPYCLLQKSPNLMSFEALCYLGAGANGIAYNFLPWSSTTNDLEEFLPWMNAVQQNNAYAKLLAEKFENYNRIGIGAYFNGYPTTQATKFIRKKWDTYCVEYPEQFYLLGLPAAYAVEDCICYTLTVNLVKSLTDKEIKDMLSKPVMMDGETLAYLNERGFGEYTGFKATLSNTDMLEVTLPHELNSGVIHIRNAHTYFGWSGSSYIIEKTKENAFYLTELTSFQEEKLGYGSGIYENRLGGKIYVGGYSMYNISEGKNRSDNIKKIIRYLTNDCIPAYIQSHHRSLLWAKTEGDRTSGAIIANVAMGKNKEIIIAVKTEKKQMKLYRFLDGNILESLLTASGTDGAYTLFTIPEMNMLELCFIEEV